MDKVKLWVQSLITPQDHYTLYTWLVLVFGYAWGHSFKFLRNQDSSFDDLRRALFVVSKMGSGCLACFDKSKATTTVDVPVNGSKDVFVEEHWSELRNPSVASEDFWTNTTLDMESNAQGSVSSISTSNLTVDSQGRGCISTDSAEFVNQGLVLWNQTRQQWVGNKKSETCERRVGKPILNENVTYESLLGSNKRFPQPIPLDVSSAPWTGGRRNGAVSG